MAPTKLISTSVGFQDSKGTVVANGMLMLQLSQTCTVTAGGGQVTTEPIYLNLDSSGKITTTAIWFNDELSPSGTIYYGTVYASNKTRMIPGLDKLQYSITGASFDLATAVQSSAASPSYSGAVLLTPTGNQVITTGNLTLSTGNLVTTSGNISSGGTLSVTGTSSFTGAATFSSTINKVTITAPSSSATLTIANGKTLTVNNILTLAGTDSTTHTFPNNTGTVAEINFANVFSADQTFKRVKASGTSPTASSTGIGASGSVAVPVGTDSFMILQLVVAGAGPAATGTITVTLTSSIGSTASIGMCCLNNADTGQWDARATIKQKSNSTTAPTFAWDNNGVALTAGSNYQVCIYIIGE